MKRPSAFIRLIALPVLLLAVWAGCSRQTAVNEDALYMAGDIEIYPDSIVIDGRQYTAVNRSEITGDWAAEPRHTASAASLPALTSSSRMAEALYAKGLSRYHDAPLSPLDIYLSGAILDPARSMETLRSLAPDGIISRPGFPLTSDNEAWAAAAMEVYHATGSEDWLKEAYRIITASLMGQSAPLRAGDGLIRGLPSYLQRLKGYTPSWMEPVDRFQIVALSTNTWHYATLNTAAAMARLLRRKAEREWESMAVRTRNAINDNFWVPSASYYGQYMYGDMWRVLSPSADNFANPLTVILGIATPEMASRITSSRPMLPEGIPTVSPIPAGGEAVTDPRVQTLNGIAASRTADEEALLAAIGTVWQQSLGPDISTEWPTLLLRGIMGISLTDEGMTFAPIVPQKLGPRLSLSGLRYREAVLDIHIHGSGDKIASFAIDSLRQAAPLVTPDLSGRHRVDITMSGNRLSDSPASVKAEAPAKAPPTPRVYWSDGRNGKIINFDPATTYEVYVNGILSETLNSPTYAVTDTGTAVIDIVPVLNGVSGYAPRSHISAPPSARIHIPATAITPRRPPLHLIRNRDMASHYIELAARHNTRLTFYVQAPSDGDYFLHIGYSNGSGETAMRTLEVNDSYAGTLVCPPIRQGDWLTTRPSSTLVVSLRNGVNKLSLFYVNSTILLHDIYLLRK